MLNNNKVRNTTRFKKRRFNSSAKNNNNKRQLSLALSPENLSKLRVSFSPETTFLPLCTRMTHQYYEQVNFAAVTTPQVYVYRGNSPYDPNQTGTGVQPVGWDNMLTFYESSFCVGSRISVRIANNINSPIQVAIAPTPTSTTVSDFNGMMIYPGVKTISLDGANRGGKSYGQLSLQESTLVFLRSGYDRDYIATGQQVSGRQWYWTIAAQCYDQASFLNMHFQVTIDYDVVWLDRKLLPLS